MAPEIPNIDMGAIQAMDIQQTYWLLYKHIMKDFVHRGDLRLILEGNTVSTFVEGACPTGVVTGIGEGRAEFPGIDSNVVATAVGATYEGLAKTGKAAFDILQSSLETIL